MFINQRRSWEIRESEVTPESAFLSRRSILAAGGISAGSLMASQPVQAQSVLGFIESIVGNKQAKDNAEPDPSASLYPVKRNEAFKLDRDLTPEDVNASYNNFYEFGSHKRIARAAQALRIRPWTVVLDGMVEETQTIAIDDLLAKMPLEERLYRHRCVEAWSMTIPWSGFAMAELVKLAKPLSGAKYVRMETFNDPEMAPGQRASFQPWPYVEGVTMEEATNDLAFLVTGAYGKPLAKQFGSPLRLALPWKYGFKSIKSIVKFTFTDQRPVSFWEQLQAREYGFWANVNPKVDHPRWSQATERVLHTGVRVPTLLYNGYGDEVAHMYKNLTEKDRPFT